jgi:phosphoserine phosphatase
MISVPLAGELDRRSLLVGAIATVAAGAALGPKTSQAQGQNDPLRSWNDGAPERAILDFVRATTDASRKAFVPPDDRIATFDQDGTLWVEQPLYTQAMFALDRVHALAPVHPEWKGIEPFRSVLSGAPNSLALLTERDWFAIVTTTHSGMSTDAFAALVESWLGTARDPRFKRPYTDLVYQPMREVMDYLRANGFRTYIVTGGGQDFVRVFSKPVYGVPPEQVVGSTIETKYGMKDSKPVLMRLPEVGFIDDGVGKAVGIDRAIGKRPCAAFGNSDGDREMLEWTGAGEGTRLRMLVHHDDGQREYAYGPAGGLPATKVGVFSEALMNKARNSDWSVIRMRDDWRSVFAFDESGALRNSSAE